ncbi:calcium-binding protein [Jannaschia aquimarina]|uniref:HlyA_1 protein n=1 Tax=Jannaschia aquimarina TaxID=935700 RepID=A0A0D1EHL2_9RHOB|nr:calcium-binding protein [Jannaschia aquimarina]KIT16331.1 Hemolysin, plasmid [Jannaschia aquimarina]SNT26057.1 Hemolysin-type calcium-binding repeat-containing protein [Jannaschia aquimarina]
MKLSIATHFSHGGAYSAKTADDLLRLIDDLGVQNVRDGLSWARVEASPGQYDFDAWREGYADTLADAGFDLTLTFMARNPLYDGGKTAHSAEGIAAFADYVAATLDRFPDIQRIAIGNEFNGLNDSFVSGPAASNDLTVRAEHQTRILKAVHDRLADDHPDVAIIGGAMHSTPTGYVSHLIEAGAMAYMDHLDIHPYGLDPSEAAQAFERLNAVLDEVPAEIRPTLVATEFGQSAVAGDPLSNADYLTKMAAVMSAAGFEMAAWYALLDEDRSGTPDMGLYQSRSEANDMVAGFRFVADLLDRAGRAVEVDLGAGLEAYRFEDGTMMVWGSAQAISIEGRDLAFLSADGRPIPRPERIDDSVVVVTGREIEISAGDGPGVLADSFYDFSLDPDGDTSWSYHAEKTARGKTGIIDLEVMDGQDRMADLWNPYLGGTHFRPFAVTAKTVRPADFNDYGTNERAVVERFTVEESGALDIVASYDLARSSTDGVVLELRLNGETIKAVKIDGRKVIALRDVTVEAGDELDFVVRDGGSDNGDVLTRHVRILEADPARSTESLVHEHSVTDIIDGNETPPPLESGEEDLDVVRGTPGGETLLGGAGDDTLVGGAGNDLLVAGAGDDALRGNEGDDRLEAGAGRDRLYGGQGQDVLVGGEGTARMKGEAGDDRLISGLGKDVMIGGEGADTFEFRELSGNDIIKDLDAEDGDVIDLGGLDLASADQVRIATAGTRTFLEVDQGDGWDMLTRLEGDVAGLPSGGAQAVENGLIVL